MTKQRKNNSGGSKRWREKQKEKGRGISSCIERK